MTYAISNFTVYGEHEDDPGGLSIKIVPYAHHAAYPWWSEPTRDVIAAMDELPIKGATVLDFGCGASAILALVARKMGATLVLDARSESIADAQEQLGMKEGFDVGMEMSGSPDAFRDLLTNMCHGGKIALLGILPEMAIDWSAVALNSLTIQGIYGREMYETWYKMTMMIQGGLDIAPIITHRFHYTEFEQAFEVMRSGDCGKVILDWAEE